MLLLDLLSWVYWIFVVGVFWFALFVFGYIGYWLRSQRHTG